MNYLLDTNILVHLVRKSPVKAMVEQEFHLADTQNTSIVSVVSLGEIRSLAIQNHWGQQRIDILEEILKQYLVADINSEDVIERYAEIDAFSQGKLPGRPLGLTARNMTKNDLWIAATASVLEATLITTDTDFAHLDGVFLNLAQIAA